LNAPIIKNKEDVRNVLRKMRTGVKRAHFEARTGKTDRAVLLFLIKQGIEVGAYNVYPGTRNISVNVGIQTYYYQLTKLSINRETDSRAVGKP
jgi:hypothetical protein